jgi:hypothetical protein
MISDWGGGRRNVMALEKLHRMPLDTLMIINCDLFSPGTARAGPAIGTYRLDNHHGAPQPIRG